MKPNKTDQALERLMRDVLFHEADRRKSVRIEINKRKPQPTKLTDTTIDDVLWQIDVERMKRGE